jgi:hypothetical protein
VNLHSITRLWNGQLGNCGSIRQRQETFLTPGLTQLPIQWVSRSLLQECSGQGVKPTTHLQLVTQNRRLRVRIHQHSRVESSPGSQRCGRLFGHQIMTACKKAYAPAESSRVESRESCRVKSLDAPRFSFVSRTPVVGCQGCYFVLGNECKKVDSFSSGPTGNLRYPSLWTQKQRLHSQLLMKITQMG